MYKRQAWEAINKTSYNDYDMEFTSSNGTVIGATGKMRTKIVGHAIIRLIFQSQQGEAFTIFTRAMIVEDLQGQIYLGQDIFQAKHIFHSLTRDHMHILYKNRRFACPYIKPTRHIHHITETTIDESPRVCFAAAKEQRIKPNSRQLISINVDPAQAYKLSEEKESCLLYTSPSPRD